MPLALLLKSPIAYLGAALLALSIALAFSHQRNKALAAEKATLVQRLATLTGTLETSNRVASECDAATRTLRALADSRGTQLDAAAARIAQASKQIATTRALLRAKEDSDHALPDCETLLRSDLRVCPGHADGVRHRSGAVPGQSGAGTSTDTSTP